MWYYITVSPKKAVGKMPDPLPKAGYLKGSLHIENKRCGKPNCRCVRGYLHGPFFYRRWRQDGSQKKEYVRHENVAAVLSAIARRQALEREVVEIRKQTRRSIEA
jgi:hypothetical protein